MRTFALFPRLEERRRQSAGTLSGGEQQMLAIGRALMSRPKLLMLDEPSMGLAPIVAQRIFEVIRDFNRAGVTVLMVEQNARLALELANRAYVMESGVLVPLGPGGRAVAQPEGARGLPRRKHHRRWGRHLMERQQGQRSPRYSPRERADYLRAIRDWRRILSQNPENVFAGVQIWDHIFRLELEAEAIAALKHALRQVEITPKQAERRLDATTLCLRRLRGSGSAARAMQLSLSECSFHGRCC